MQRTEFCTMIIGERNVFTGSTIMHPHPPAIEVAFQGPQTFVTRMLACARFWSRPIVLYSFTCVYHYYEVIGSRNSYNILSNVFNMAVKSLTV